MLPSQRFLAKCHSMIALGIRFMPEVGMRVVRGFADLGFEEFSVLPLGKVVSLYTGSIAPMGEEWEKHFSRVPLVDELVDMVIDDGGRIDECCFVDDRTWRVRIVDTSGGSYVAESRELVEALLDGYLAMRRDR